MLTKTIKYIMLFVAITSMGVLINTASALSFVEAEFNNNDYKLTLNPHSSTEYNLVVTNPSNSLPLKLTLNGNDGRYSKTGEILVNSTKFGKKYIGNWINIEQSELFLKPLESQTVKIRITIPTIITPGNFIGGISIIPVKDQIQDANTFSAKIGFVKYIPIIIQIPGDIKPDFTIKNIQTKFFEKEKTLYVKYDIDNIGNSSLIAHSKIEIYRDDKLLETIYPEEQKLGLLKNSTINNAWNKAEYFQKYKIKVDVSIDQYDDLTEKTVKQISTQTFETSITTIPYQTISTYIFFIILIIVIIIIIFIIKYFWHRFIVKSTQSYIVEKNETLEDIANKFKTNWHLIAYLNNIHPPYSIKEGQRLFVPKIKTIDEKEHKNN